MARTNKTRFAVLGILTYGPMAGYDIKRNFDKGPSHFWRESFGQIYPILRKLTTEGLVEKRVEFHEGKPARKIYELTDKGWQTLREWLAAPPEDQSLRDEHLLKLFFGRHVPRTVSIGHVRAIRDRMHKDLREYDRIESFLRDRLALDPDAQFKLLTLRCGQHQVRARLEWCDESLKALEDSNDRPD